MIRRASIDDIFTATCSVMGVYRFQLLDSGRHERIVLARSIIVHLARQLTVMSYPEIAMFLGRKSHSGPWAAHHRIQRLLDRERRMPPHERLITRLIEAIAYRVERGREAAA